MNGINRRKFALSVGMVGAAAAAYGLKPRTILSKAPVGSKLNDDIPMAFGAWRVDNSVGNTVVNPETQEKLDELYSETLSRVYVDGANRRMMLSLAYGRNQSKAVQIHKPEVCYVAQGFQLSTTFKGSVKTDLGVVPVMRIVATLGRRIEPITYWIRSGDDIVSGWYEQNKSRILAGLRGTIHDGLLIRVSSISPKSVEAFEAQDRFVNELLRSIPSTRREMFLGSLSRLS
jgi:EpsI family protein